MESTERRRRVNEEATQWWLQLQTQGMPRQQREAFVDWLRESPVHVAEMLRVASVHGALEQFEHWARIATEGSGNDEQVVVPLHHAGATAAAGKRWLRHGWRIAAAVAGLAVATALLLPALRGQVIQTDRGERREVVLADGSVVQIDPQSRLRVRFEDRERRVFLDSGRALFRVSRNPVRPFLVEAAATTVRAVGTAFGVERRPQGIVVTVSEGKVAIEGPGATPLLVANEQVTVSAAGSATPVRKVDSARALAWAEGRLNFENTPVREVVAQFNRYNSIRLHVEDEELARRPISGVFNAANPESFIAFIQATTAVHVERDSDGDIVIASDR
ncbi:MAG TPA: FecR domain-containing protein [Steroidobacteraceae bacterium]|jgi:transmembrane sensor